MLSKYNSKLFLFPFLASTTDSNATQNNALALSTSTNGNATLGSRGSAIWNGSSLGGAGFSVKVVFLGCGFLG